MTAATANKTKSRIATRTLLPDFFADGGVCVHSVANFCREASLAIALAAAGDTGVSAIGTFADGVTGSCPVCEAEVPPRTLAPHSGQKSWPSVSFVPQLPQKLMDQVPAFADDAQPAGIWVMP